MAGDVKLTATSRASTVVLAADPDLSTSGIVASSKWITEVGLLVTLPASAGGGFRWNLRLAAGSVARVLQPWTVQPFDVQGPVTSLSMSGIAINIGPSAADYWSLPPNEWGTQVFIHGVVAFRAPTGGTGTAALEWCQDKSVVGATVLDIGSFYSARNP